MHLRGRLVPISLILEEMRKASQTGAPEQGRADIKGNPWADTAERKQACNSTLTTVNQRKETQVLVCAANSGPGLGCYCPVWGDVQSSAMSPPRCCSELCAALSISLRGIASGAVLCCHSAGHPMKSSWNIFKIFSSTGVNDKVIKDTGKSHLGKHSQSPSM